MSQFGYTFMVRENCAWINSPLSVGIPRDIGVCYFLISQVNRAVVSGHLINASVATILEYPKTE